jgi:hypothetical protein
MVIPPYSIRTVRPELYFAARDWHLSINACRSASLSKDVSTDCIPAPEQFVEFTSGAPPPQLTNAALSAITDTIYLELIKLLPLYKSLIFKPEVQQWQLLGVVIRRTTFE